jgi:hypothetical protein
MVGVGDVERGESVRKALDFAVTTKRFLKRIEFTAEGKHDRIPIKKLKEFRCQ